jgi:hypothetical protein
MAKSRNQKPHPTPRAKAAARRERLASVVLFVVIAFAVGLTAYVWMSK